MSMIRSTRSLSAALLTALTLIVGCGGSDVPELASVTGTVLLDGKPLPNATVVFEPQGARSSTGRTDDQGRFTLSYSADMQGAVLGRHTVRITNDFEETGPGGEALPTENTLPAVYNLQSTLSKEVVAGENDFSFELESNPPGGNPMFPG